MLRRDGFTGELVVRALVRHQVRPVLAGRNRDRLASLAQDCGGLDVVAADASDAASVRGLIDADDVLVTTVGPFRRLGWPAVSTAAGMGAAYLDSTGEPAFVRRIVTELGARAASAGARLLPAFGYDYVPGNLAAALALRDAPQARRSVGYFVRGRGGGGISGGTAASAADILLRPGYAWRDGALRSARPGRGCTPSPWRIDAARPSRLPVRSTSSCRGSIRVSATSTSTSVGSAGSGDSSSSRHRSPPDYSAYPAPRRRWTRSRSGSSPVRQVARTRSAASARTLAVAEALDLQGEVLTDVVLEGPSPYDLTAELLAWGAIRAAQRDMTGPGVLGPVDAFGLEALERAAAAIGLRRT